MEYSREQLFMALLITFLSGVATVIGVLSTYVAKDGNKKFLSFALGFSAGVMLFVSFFRILDRVKHKLIVVYGEETGNWYVIAGFFIGVVFIVLFEHLVHKFSDRKLKSGESNSPDHLRYLGYFTALAISIHNFPEGFATFIACLSDIKTGLSIAIAVAIHNIPIGIAIAVPLYFSTRKRIKAFWVTFATGMVAPLGAILGFLILKPYMSPVFFAFIMAIVAGILVVVAIDELLPVARSYGNHHIAVYGMITGMFVMAVALMNF